MEKLMTRAAPGSYMGTTVTLLTAGSEMEVGTIYNATRAEAIVRCVDAHDALVAVAIAAAETCRAEWARLQRVDPRAAGFWKLGEEQARAALALARGK